MAASNVQFVDPAIGTKSLESMGLSPQELAAIRAGSQLDPAKTVQQFQEKDLKEQKAIESYELARMQQENDEMRRKLESTTGVLQEVQTGYANVQGQLTAMQAAQQATSTQQQLDQQYAFTQEELDQSADLLPVMSKVVGRQRAEMQAELDSRLAQERQIIAEQATAPLKQELEQLKADTALQKQQNRNNFNANVIGKISELGLGDSTTLSQMPQFQARYNQETYPGSGVMWGDEFKRKAEAEDPSVLTMLEDFRYNHSDMDVPRDDMQVPASQKPSQPITPSESANLGERDRLTSKYRENMQNANRGVFPPGCETRQQYMKKQSELRSQIDSIPVT